MANLPFPEDQILDTTYYGDQGIPHEAFKWLRENDPVRKFHIDDYLPFWAITLNEDIHEVEKNAEVFTSYPNPTLAPISRRPTPPEEMSPEQQAAIQEVLKGSPVADLFKSGELMRTLIHMDAPDHTKYRDLVQPWFKPANLATFEGKLEDITREILDDMMGDGGIQECEFVNTAAVFHPLRMICELLDVPKEDEQFILKVTNEFFAGDDEDLSRGEGPLDFLATVRDIFEYFNKTTERLRKNPNESLASYIANGQIDGKPIPLMETVSYYLIIATAGHDTTRNSIAGGLLALLRNPEQLKKWQENPDLTKFATEEIIRWTVPVIQFARTAAQDYELRGKQIKEGDLVAMFYASGCRDDQVIDNPFEFRIDRSPNKHIAFGSGPHVCLGMLLARMEIRIFFKQFLERIEMIELAGEPQLIKSSFIHGVKKLPIRYKLRPAE